MSRVSAQCTLCDATPVYWLVPVPLPVNETVTGVDAIALSSDVASSNVSAETVTTQ